MPELTDDPSTLGPRPTGPSRRTALRVVAVTGAGAALLAACGGGGDSEAGTSGDDTSTPAGSGTDATDGDTPTQGSGGGLVAAADVPVGGGVILEARKVVVTQPTEGQFRAFSAVCTHQSCTVASVRRGVISCPCHGSAFNVADGSVKNGPATRPLKEIAVAVDGDQVVEA
jgi:Rieske Fe-S protein